MAAPRSQPEVTIDTRPLRVILLERSLRPTLPVATVLLYWGIVTRDVPPDLTPAGLGFTLPIGTPANAIAYSSGHLSIRDMMVPGAILAVASWVVFNLVARFYWPFLGIHIGAAA
jgi:hypothetical protein